MIHRSTECQQLVSLLAFECKSQPNLQYLVMAINPWWKTSYRRPFIYEFSFSQMAAGLPSKFGGSSPPPSRPVSPVHPVQDAPRHPVSVLHLPCDTGASSCTEWHFDHLPVGFTASQDSFPPNLHTLGAVLGSHYPCSPLSRRGAVA